ncbi:MAG: copper homeostasis protein CutC, partial [Succinivibrionaceae bacterium]
MKNYILECCVDSVESALNAVKGGASRLELCANLPIGGTTPDLALFRQIRKESDIRMHILIRPRFGDFCYSEYEMEIMRE